MTISIDTPPAWHEPLMLAEEDWPITDHLVTANAQSMVTIYCDRQMRLLTESLYASWKPGGPFMAASNVGIFFVNENPAIVPSVFVSLDVEPNTNFSLKEGQSYLMWDKGPPDIVIDIVSTQDEGAFAEKRRIYERSVRPCYYVRWDPRGLLAGGRLQAFGMFGGSLVPTSIEWLKALGLGLRIWQGTYEHASGEWLRWIDRDGRFLPTGEELSAISSAAISEAAIEKERADRLAAKLRDMGVDPDR